ncbi:MAG: glycogen/starch synthase [Paludibacteraceae bacterium]|nr:glycogen/starch synthase [Paludibacteraceae bacterium]
MKEPNHVLFISQEISPYLADETPIRTLNRRLPEVFQSHHYDTRTFMPKFGEINERRNQLHEVIRLSGTNLVIEDTDHPLLIKVTSVQSARLQIYFIDNDDYFRRRKGVTDEKGKEYPDNDERCIFYARGVLETIKNLRWTPDIIQCSGWMSALAPIYIKKAYADTPFFANSKVVLAIDNNTYQTPFSTKFAQKMLIEGVSPNDVRSIAGFPVGYEELMRLAIDYSDAIVFASDNVNQHVVNYAETKGKPILPYQENNDMAYLDFCNSLLENHE